MAWELGDIDIDSGICDGFSIFMEKGKVPYFTFIERVHKDVEPTNFTQEPKLVCTSFRKRPE